ncbi:MAG TPA: arginine deiminase-related protein [Woeseiaceae bacterium]|nr:arginine deiminase-related protein [Woeseiaceae bacterium]
MVRPARFESNPLTAESNRFQARPDLTADAQQALALGEFNALVAALTAHGIEVFVFDDTPEPHTPDAIFPNNWVSFHADGRVVLYPMEAANRRTERRLDIVESLEREHGFYVREIVDLAPHEQAGNFLEGTGSMVLDRVNRIAYACLSSRTRMDALGDFAQRMDYEVLAFDAQDADGNAIYHTNVLMCIGEKLAIICAAAIVHDEQRIAVLDSFRETGHETVLLSHAQMAAFAGNMLELRNRSGERVIAMSQQALDSLDKAQVKVLQSNGAIVTSPINNIESSAGGSVRCMLAEIHLPRKG